MRTTAKFLAGNPAGHSGGVMHNLYYLEKLVEERAASLAENRNDDVDQLDEHRAERRSPVKLPRPVRVRLGQLLIRVGTRMAA